MAMSDSSLVSTKDLEMRIIPMFVNFHMDWDNGQYSKLGYTIQVTNKSDNIIYVDLANTFRIYTDGTSKNFYDSETTTITNGTNSGVGVNLGGAATILGAGLPLRLAASSVSIAGGRQSSISTTYTNQRILSIPPHSQKILFEYEEVRTNKSIVLPEYKILSDLEIYAFDFPSLKRGQLKEEEYISYSETETPYTAQYYITYSTSPDFLSYTHLYAKLYTRYIVGADISDYESNFWGNGITKKQKDIQKHITNFWTVDGACDIIIGREGYILKN